MKNTQERSIAEIAKEYNVSRTCVYGWLERGIIQPGKHIFGKTAIVPEGFVPPKRGRKSVEEHILSQNE